MENLQMANDNQANNNIIKQGENIMEQNILQGNEGMIQNQPNHTQNNVQPAEVTQPQVQETITETIQQSPAQTGAEVQPTKQPIQGVIKDQGSTQGVQQTQGEQPGVDPISQLNAQYFANQSATNQTIVIPPEMKELSKKMSVFQIIRANPNGVTYRKITETLNMKDQMVHQYCRQLLEKGFIVKEEIQFDFFDKRIILKPAPIDQLGQQVVVKDPSAKWKATLEYLQQETGRTRDDMLEEAMIDLRDKILLQHSKSSVSA